MCCITTAHIRYSTCIIHKVNVIREDCCHSLGTICSYLTLEKFQHSIFMLTAYFQCTLKERSSGGRETLNSKCSFMQNLQTALSRLMKSHTKLLPCKLVSQLVGNMLTRLQQLPYHCYVHTCKWLNGEYSAATR